VKLKITVAILSVILLGLLILIPFVTRDDDPEQPKASSSSSLLISQPTSQPTQPTSSATVPSTLPTTIHTKPSTQPTTVPTQPPTQPTTQPQKKPYSDNPKANAFIEARLDKWTCPLKDPFGEVVGSRTFASSRGGGTRAHAGLDFVAPHGTKIYAVTSGTVQRVALFYQNTYGVEVLNDDGSILRYCEIASNLKAGDYVKQGDVIGTIMRADGGTEMLHIEVYLGDGEGSLTQTWNDTYSYVKVLNGRQYKRRSDLLDPTFLKDLAKPT